MTINVGKPARILYCTTFDMQSQEEMWKEIIPTDIYVRPNILNRWIAGIATCIESRGESEWHSCFVVAEIAGISYLMAVKCCAYEVQRGNESVEVSIYLGQGYGREDLACVYVKWIQ